MNPLTYGQWVGSAIDVKQSVMRVTLNIEKRTPGLAQILSHSPELRNFRLCSTAPFTVSGQTITLESPDTKYFNPATGDLIPAKDFYAQHNIQEPLVSRIVYRVKTWGSALTGFFENDVGRKGTFELLNTTAEPASKADHTLSWKEYKAFAADKYLNNESVLFRGQPSNSFKLRTSFHRCHRNDLLRYLHEDVFRLRHAVNGISSFYYCDNNAEHLGALLSLAQHHGHPTPLLDWTLSPYVAAFFAFSEPAPSAAPAEAVRIFVFDLTGWSSVPSPNIIYDPLPSLTFHRFSAHNNPRFIPQQSIGSFTNMDDIEAFVRTVEKASGRRHLTTIDIPSSEKQTVLSELRLMGITSGSLFPGLDGLCRSLKEQYFNYD